MPKSRKSQNNLRSWDERKFLITSIGAVVLFFIGLWQFSITSRNDFAKPVFQKQLELCVEASNAAATLAQQFSKYDTGVPLAERNLPAETVTAYFALYYGKLAVVEDQCVYNTMVKFKQHIFDGLASDVSPSRAALRIAFACRRMLSKTWNSGLLGIYDPQGMVESFNDLDDYKETLTAIEGCKG